jgi:hypothetical protein
VPNGRREDIIGRKLIIRAQKQYGSARLLNGLTGTVIALHPIAPFWVKVHLDVNLVTPHREWSVPDDRLMLYDYQTESKNLMSPNSSANPLGSSVSAAVE